MCDVIYDCGGASSTTSFQSTFNQLTSSTSNYITTNSSSASSSVSAIQSAAIDIGGSIFPPCSIDVTQTVNISSQTGVNLAKSSTSDLRNFISTQLQNAADQKSSASSSFLGGSSSTSTNTSVTQNIQNIVNTTVSDSNYASMSSEVMGKQDGRVHIHGDCHAPIKFDQNFCANVLATNIMTQILTQLGGLASNTSSSTTVSQSSDASTHGPLDFLNQLGPIAAAICGVLLLLCSAGACFVIVMMFLPKGPPKAS